jgi:hypothetical protein
MNTEKSPKETEHNALNTGALKPSDAEVLQTFQQAEIALLRMAPSGEDPDAEEVYACLELMRDWLLGA